MGCKCNGQCKDFGKPGCKCAIKARERLAKQLSVLSTDSEDE